MPAICSIPNTELREIAHKAIDRLFDEAIDKGDHVTVNMMRAVRDVTQPGDQYAQYALGHGKRLVFEVPAREGESYT